MCRTARYSAARWTLHNKVRWICRPPKTYQQRRETKATQQHADLLNFRTPPVCFILLQRSLWRRLAGSNSAIATDVRIRGGLGRPEGGEVPHNAMFSASGWRRNVSQT